jgi:crotonobetainyl-CoA:carnitine CoA-transferase CaiB-like acyl-CoA transferase
LNGEILHNIRILDFTRVLAGPYATRLLADFGAEVIKVQQPGVPEREDDFARKYDTTWNRNKRGITLNMSKPEGIGLAKRLVAICDAVVENFTPRVMENWGLDYPNLKKIKPDIILVSMSAMGQQSPDRDYTGYAPTVHALSGLTALTSFPGKAPTGPGFSYADHIAGLYASLGLLAALEARNKTGVGQYVDISETAAVQGLLKDAGRVELEGVYECKDGRFCALVVANAGEWPGLKKAMGDPPWFDGLVTKPEKRGELEERIKAWAKWFTAAEFMPLLQQNGLAAGVVQDAGDIANDKQLKKRGFFIKKDKLTDASPVKMNNIKAAYKRQAPAAGQDNTYVYGKLLGLSRQDMTALQENGVI